MLKSVVTGTRGKRGPRQPESLSVSVCLCLSVCLSACLSVCLFCSWAWGVCEIPNLMGPSCVLGLSLSFFRHWGSLSLSLLLAHSQRVACYSFFLSAGLRGHVVTLRPSARPTTPCVYGAVGFGHATLSLSLSLPLSLPGMRGMSSPQVFKPTRSLVGYRE